VKPTRVAQIFSRLREVDPEPKTELEYVNDYTLLVAVVLSAQSTDKGVNKATSALFRKVKTPDQMVTLGEEGLKEYIKTIGLFNAKAKNIIALSIILVDKHGGQIPSTREELVALPGVGRKTANVVLHVAFGQATMPVDTHIFRLAHRLGLSEGKTPDRVEEDLLRVIPTEFLNHAHHWLILHGRYTCLARRPKCSQCIIHDLCTSPDKTI
jgi:endonuclease III